ncbi:acyl-CoA thioester hydrolase [Colwellia chukchiensis]|uniref:Acyl-CoA thioester hydrolase n=1 Tax=Colwellia chukchiensis TaxID=641665 RepID=A0A1H7QKL4_9GAMM|nr:thioesterase family protein [Colwellia chukchiensis]SEL48308.1 acyl-CoA thioester hydrolase [Colwellia chukchiensis]
MIEETIKPRFCETDGLGHINNTVVAQWFEGARDPIFKWFTPDLNLKAWKLILAKTTVEFHAELQYGADVELKSHISRIGNSSFDVYQEAWQQGVKCASGTAVMVHFNYQSKKSEKISATALASMQRHYIEL